jgi:hypothetical protein
VTTSGVVFNKCLFNNKNDYMLVNDSFPTTFTDCTIDNTRDASTGFGRGFRSAGNYTRCKIVGCSLGIVLKPGPSTIQSCYITTCQNGPNDHLDCIFFAGGENGVLIQDCWMSTPPSFGTSEIFCQTSYDNEPINDVRINHNRLIGTPSYAMYFTNSHVNSPMTNIVVTNNEVQVGAYGGYWTLQNCTPSFSGNVDAFTGANIDHS